MRKRVGVLAITSMLMLSGCSSVDIAIDARLRPIIEEKSGILETEEYIKYQEYLNNGELDADGCYIDKEPEEDTIANEANGNKDKGTVHVTFAENQYVEIDYYTDLNMTSAIDKDNCYLNPGNTIYGKVKEYKNPKSNLYQLSEYRVVEYDAEGHMKKESPEQLSDGMLKYAIPNDFTGTEISILPIGDYPDRELSMTAYYIDDKGNECTLGSAGTWSINGENITGDIPQISSIETYSLKYTFDMQNYFYVECEPECFTKEPEKEGFVEFLEAEATDEDVEYRVRLQPYLNLKMKFNKDAKIYVNQSGTAISVEKNKEWSSSKLKYGDTITIETKGECSITGGNYQHISATKEPSLDGNRYIFKVVPEATDNVADELKKILDVQRVFDVNLNTNCKYGTCTYKLDGEVVSGEVKVQEGQELTLTYKITNKDYVFVENSGGIGGFIHDLFKSNERTVMLPIMEEIEGTTINPDDRFEIVEKED